MRRTSETAEVPPRLIEKAARWALLRGETFMASVCVGAANGDPASHRRLRQCLREAGVAL